MWWNSPKWYTSTVFFDEENVVEDDNTIHLFGGDRVNTKWIDTDNRLRVYPRFPPVHDAYHEARKPSWSRPASSRRRRGSAWRGTPSAIS